jgi:hypothetical protein
MEYIKRMETEFIELYAKIEKLVDFLLEETKNPRLTTEEERELLANQSSHMNAYLMFLNKRIEVAKQKEKMV